MLDNQLDIEMTTQEEIDRDDKCHVQILKLESIFIIIFRMLEINSVTFNIRPISKFGKLDHQTSSQKSV